MGARQSHNTGRAREGRRYARRLGGPSSGIFTRESPDQRINVVAEKAQSTRDISEEGPQYWTCMERGSKIQGTCTERAQDTVRCFPDANRPREPSIHGCNQRSCSGLGLGGRLEASGSEKTFEALESHEDCCEAS